MRKRRQRQQKEKKIKDSILRKMTLKTCRGVKRKHKRVGIKEAKENQQTEECQKTFLCKSLHCLEIYGFKNANTLYL